MNRNRDAIKGRHRPWLRGLWSPGEQLCPDVGVHPAPDVPGFNRARTPAGSVHVLISSASDLSNLPASLWQRILRRCQTKTFVAAILLAYHLIRLNGLGKNELGTAAARSRDS
jgi:hypothetical protein